MPQIAKDRDLRSEPLFVERFVCVLRKGHPLEKRRLSLKRFAELEHVVVAPQTSEQRSIVDVLLEKQQLSRRVTRTVSSFSLALPLIAASDRVAVLPQSLVKLHAGTSGVAMRLIPLDVPPLEMSLAWHASSEGDPKHVWTRQLIRGVAATVWRESTRVGKEDQLT